MIKIELSKEIKKDIEDKHWNWFDKRSKKCFRGRSETYHDFICSTLGLKWKDVERLIKGNLNEINSFKSQIGIISRPDIPNKKDGETESDYNKRIQPIKDNQKKYDDLMTAFGYENFCESKNKNVEKIWNAYEFCKRIGVNVCVYCNRQYIYTIGDVYDKIDRPEIDHFFPKSKYPYLSCSLYNFIPSCHTCNHGKRDFGEGIVYPYEDCFGKDFLFRVKFSDNLTDSANLLDVENAYVFFKNLHCKYGLTRNSICKKCYRVVTSKKTFHLEEVYNKHKIDLNDIFIRYRNYFKPKIDNILNLVLDSEMENQSFSKEEKEKIIQMYAKKMKNTFLGLPLGCGEKQYPLRKFKEDIIEQLNETRKKMGRD